MTAKRDLKRRIRARQARTGESYTAARRATIEKPAIEVVEMDDVTAIAAEVGLRGRIAMARALAAEIDPRDALVRLRDLALATSDDPAMELLRAVALRGERPELTPSLRGYSQLRRFVARVRAGLGGVSEGGSVLALPLAGRRGLVMMVVHLGFGVLRPETSPAIVLTTVDGAAFYVDAIALRSPRR